MRFHSGNSPIHEQVRDYLIDQVQDGVLLPGTTLPSERKLSEEFGVSRHTVRQALSALEGFGLVSIRHGSGITVTGAVSDATYERVSRAVVAREGTLVKLLEARRAMEPHMTRLAAERRSDEFLATLQPFIRYGEGAHATADPGRSTSFHREIARATGNLVFDGIMRTLTAGPRRAEAMLTRAPEYREEWEDHHQLIFQAIKDKDADEAEHQMALHLDAIIEVSKLPLFAAPLEF